MNNVDVLRALAVTSVVCHHLGQVFQWKLPFLGNHGGWFGVQLFFLISGYLIIHSAKQYPIKSYCIHRVLRIFPAYIVSYLGIGLLNNLLSMSRISSEWKEFVANILLLQHLFPGALIHFDVLHVTWTLTVEILWYLLAPLILILFRLSENGVLFGSIVLSTIWVKMATNGTLDFFYQDAGVPLTPDIRFLFLQNAFPAQLCFFVMGAYIRHQRERLIQLNPLLLVLLFCILTLLWPEWVHLFVNPGFFSGMGIAALLVLALQSPVLQSGFIKWIADISYSIYLIHFPVALYVSNTFDWVYYLEMLISTVLTLLFASMIYYILEKPMMNLARRF